MQPSPSLAQTALSCLGRAQAHLPLKSRPWRPEQPITLTLTLTLKGTNSLSFKSLTAQNANHGIQGEPQQRWGGNVYSPPWARALTLWHFYDTSASGLSVPLGLRGLGLGPYIPPVS